jgi:DNA-binding NtrC family response regulator/Flp pilus assembly protein TadD
MRTTPNHFDPSSTGPRRRALHWSKQASAVRAALQNHLYAEARALCEAALQGTHLRPEAEANLRCLLAESLENLARFSEAVQTLSPYEQERKREALAQELQGQICLRLGAAYGGTADLPKAISYAKQALALATRQNDHLLASKSHIVLGTLYRRLGELWFARDHFSTVIKNILRHGNHALLAQAYNGVGIVHFLEGEFESARSAFYQALEVLGQIDDPLMRGSVDVNLATIASLQGQIRESVALYERALPELERARNPRLIVNAHSNLGYSLLRLGEMQRAAEVLRFALALARECETPLITASTLETLGEWHYLQGQFDEADRLLSESLSLLKELHVGFNQAMALLTHGRGWLLAGRAVEAAVSFRISLEICEKMGDPRGRAAAQLALIEAYVALGEWTEARDLLENIRADVERVDTINLIGQLREVSGLVAFASGHIGEAIQSFNQAISIREVMGDQYRLGVAHYYLGRAQMRRGETLQAGAAFETARVLFQELNAQPLLKLTTEAISTLAQTILVSEPAVDLAEQVISILSRLLDADFSREVLLSELVRILHDELELSPVILFHGAREEKLAPLVYRGCSAQQAVALGQTISGQGANPAEASVYRIGDQQEMIWLYVGKRCPDLPDSLLDLIVRQFRIGLERSERHLPSKPPPVAPAQHLHPVTLPGLIYRSAAMRTVVEQVLSLRSSNITVLITGETGTGKELVARAIHAFSKRASHPFIPFNCAAAPRELIESQLFGHRRGAFTGATADFPGMIGAAEKGTLFLDEIGELAREMQPKLLRFLQNNEIQRLGETAPRLVDVRVIAATNRDLEAMVTANDFRADLYYRLNVIQFHLPALRERREEIPLLAEHFLARYLDQNAKKQVTLSPGVMNLLKQYDWPGNARQLENEMQRLVALTGEGETITEELLSPHIRNQARIRLVSPLAVTASHLTLAEAVAQTERHLISETLARHKGNISKTAAELGLSRYGLRKIMRRHHLVSQRVA